MIEHHVVWDGRRDGPGGALLFAPQYPRPEVQPTPHLPTGSTGPQAAVRAGSFQGRRTGSFDKVRLTLSRFREWFTAAQMSEAARLTPQQTATALHALWKHGRLAKNTDEYPARYRVCR